MIELLFLNQALTFWYKSLVIFQSFNKVDSDIIFLPVYLLVF